ncbi:MAG: hypothetical protein CMI54_05415 [Parcubacteria group bacterium]|nr:hypothetical protein [Parcubacteria group bacterium]|tara:strand:- start:11886 stop:12881 length:996 start_codon:yes stop_codon:yes gene_type:complete
MQKYQVLQIDITNRCNLRCQHCVREAINKGQIEPDFRKLKKIIENAKKLGFKEINFSGGEPTLRDDIFDLLYITKKQGLFRAITTNGIFNNSVLNNLLKSKIDLIQISIDGPKKIHEKIRGIAGIFDKIIENALRLKSGGGNVIFKCVVQKENIGYLEDLIGFLDKKKFKRIALQNILPSGKNYSFWEKNKVSDKELFNKIYTLSEKYKIGITTDNPKINLFNQKYIEKLKEYGNIYNGEMFAGCLAGIANFYVKPNLDIYPCAYIPYRLGNLYSDSLENILKKIKKTNIFFKENLRGKCKSCRFKYICGGCRAIAYTKGDIHGEDFSCDI